MYRLEITHKDGSVQVISELFDEQTFEVWKYKDTWMDMLTEALRNTSFHNNFKLIRNKDDAVLLEKTIDNRWYRSTVYYRRNMIYETVRKDLKFDFYKKDEHGLSYRIIKENNDYRCYRGVCMELGTVGEMQNTEAKAYTSVKKATHQEIFLIGLETAISKKKKKK